MSKVGLHLSLAACVHDCKYGYGTRSGKNGGMAFTGLVFSCAKKGRGGKVDGVSECMRER